MAKKKKDTTATEPQLLTPAILTDEMREQDKMMWWMTDTEPALKDVRELRVDPRNARRITPQRRKEMMQSVLLFAKMRKYRELIVRPDGLVLGGNQRISIFQEIERGKTTLGDALEGNPEWEKKTDKEKAELFAYWHNWRKNPLVEVSVADFSEAEQKELRFAPLFLASP